MNKKMKNVVDLLNEITNAGLNRMSEKVFENLDILTAKIRNNDETNEYNISYDEALACQSNINLIRTCREKLNEARRP